MIIRIEQYINQKWVHMIDIPVDDLDDAEISACVKAIHEAYREQRFYTIENEEAEHSVTLDREDGPLRVEVLRPFQTKDGDWTYGLDIPPMARMAS